jgi:hypothetical protein
MAMLDDLMAEDQASGDFDAKSLLGQLMRLPKGHPSQMLRDLRDLIPQVQADDSSLMSGITSRLGRTATAIPRGGLETMANWLQGTHDPNAVRIGQDTIAPFGMFPMGMAGRAASGAARASDAAMSARLGEQFPGEIGGGDLVRMRIAGANRMGVSGDDGMTSLYRTDGAMHRPGDAVSRAPSGLSRPANDLLSDNARSSVPGTVVQAMGDRSLTELTDTPPRFRPDRAVAATENNPYVVRQGAREGSNYFALDEAGNPIGYASTTTHPIGVKVEGVEVAKGHRGQGVANNIYDTIEQSTGLPVKPSGTLSDDGLRLWQGRDPESVRWHQSLPSEPGWNYSPRELKRLADDRGHAGAREAFEGLPPEARTPERLSTMFADNARSSVPGTVVNSMAEGQRARRPMTEWEHEARDIIERPRFTGTPTHPMTPEQRAAQFAEWQAESAGLVRRAKEGVAAEALMGRNKKPSGVYADTASAPGLVANSSQPELTEPMLMQLLRQYGMGAM